MANEKVYPKGIRVFKPRDGAPEWVLGTVLVNPIELQQWVADNAQYMTDYQGNPQLKLDLLKGKDGPYVAVNTYKAAGNGPGVDAASYNQSNKEPHTVGAEAPQSDLPF